MFRWILTAVLFLAFGLFDAEASVVDVSPVQARIEASIKYSVIGRYQAHFDSFEGQVRYDQKDSLIEGVDLRISTESIQSNCSWCDKIVLSAQLLDAKRYPEIIFTGTRIRQEGSSYIVEGVLDLHGVKRELVFPFEMVRTDDKRMTQLKGCWVINRKDFDIVWNRLLDKGGVVVANHIVVEWVINMGDIPLKEDV